VEGHHFVSLTEKLKMISKQQSICHISLKKTLFYFRTDSLSDTCLYATWQLINSWVDPISCPWIREIYPNVNGAMFHIKFLWITIWPCYILGNDDLPYNNQGNFEASLAVRYKSCNSDCWGRAVRVVFYFIFLKIYFLFFKIYFWYSKTQI
jgi:hypothetical protein